jgi:hypothetical protein
MTDATATGSLRYVRNRKGYDVHSGDRRLGFVSCWRGGWTFRPYEADGTLGMTSVPYRARWAAGEALVRCHQTREAKAPKPPPPGAHLITVDEVQLGDEVYLPARIYCDGGVQQWYGEMVTIVRVVRCGPNVAVIHFVEGDGEGDHWLLTPSVRLARGASGTNPVCWHPSRVFGQLRVCGEPADCVAVAPDHGGYRDRRLVCDTHRGDLARWPGVVFEPVDAGQIAGPPGLLDSRGAPAARRQMTLTNVDVRRILIVSPTSMEGRD